jgi:RNA polymerase sigma factor (sigma-70 family)
VIKQLQQYPDTDVIKRILNGECRFYEIIIRRYNSFLYKIGRSYSYNHQDTQDLMQETYLSAYNNLANFEGRASFKTWLTRIMLNHCYHAKKKHSYKKEVALPYNEKDEFVPIFQQQYNNEKDLMNKELGKILEHALENIPHDYKIVFTLRELNGFSIAETADVLDISESNVKVRLNRAKAMLRKGLTGMYAPADIFEFNLVYCDEMVNRVFEKI